MMTMMMIMMMMMIIARGEMARTMPPEALQQQLCSILQVTIKLLTASTLNTVFSSGNRLKLRLGQSQGIHFNLKNKTSHALSSVELFTYTSPQSQHV